MGRGGGANRAVRRLVSGELVESEQALAIGLVDELTDIDGVPARALAWLQALLQLPRKPVLATRAIARADVVEALRPENIGLDHFIDAWHDHDTQARFPALVSKLANNTPSGAWPPPTRRFHLSSQEPRSTRSAPRCPHYLTASHRTPSPYRGAQT